MRGGFAAAVADALRKFRKMPPCARSPPIWYNIQIMKQYSVGLVGVGAVGTEMIKVLKERNFPMKGSVQVFASRERDEQILGETYHVKKADENSFNGLDIVLFAGKTDVAIQLKDAVVKAGAKMIDNSRAFRQDPEVPLVVPQVNAEDLDHLGADGTDAYETY